MTSSEQYNGTHFEEADFVETYTQYCHLWPQPLYTTIIDFCGCRMETAVDLGCGAGQGTFPLTKYFNTVNDDFLAFATHGVMAGNELDEGRACVAEVKWHSFRNILLFIDLHTKSITLAQKICSISIDPCHRQLCDNHR